MRRLRLAVASLGALVLAGGPPARAAADELRFDPAPAEVCLAADPAHPADCIGRAADACMSGNATGETTIGMGFCLSAEWEWWDARLNAAYAVLMARHGVDDAALAQEGLSAPSVAGALRSAQRAWIAWRDADCDYERAQWAGGTGGGPATAGCLMQATGTRALALEAKIAELAAR